MTSTDIDALLAAVDAGDACLPILADALGEAGDARAAGLRVCLDLDWGYQPIVDRVRPGRVQPYYGWLPVAPAQATIQRWQVPDKVALRLAGAADGQFYGWYYPTRSAAYLALAQALSRE
jgi:hypothetical protein